MFLTKLTLYRAHIYWNTGYSLECSYLNGMSRFTYFQTGLFSGKLIISFTLNKDQNLIYWLVKSHNEAKLYSAELATGDNHFHLAQSVKLLGYLQENQLQGPLLYYNDRLFWVDEGNDAYISNVQGKYLAAFKTTGVLEIQTVAIVDPSLHSLPHQDVNVIPSSIKTADIRITGTWNNFTILWSPVKNVNYGQVFYDVILEDDEHEHYHVSSDTEYVYPNTDLKPYSRIKLVTEKSIKQGLHANIFLLFQAIRSFTYWASSKQTVTEIYSPMSEPTKPTKLRIYIYPEQTAHNAEETITAEFRWSVPQFPNGIILNYVVNVWSIQRNQRVTEVENELRDGNFAYLKNLKPNTTYYFQVSAANEAGEGPPSEVLEAKSSINNPVPKLLVAKMDSVKIIDVDFIEEEKEMPKATYAVDVGYLFNENKMFWIEEDGVIKSSDFQGNNSAIISQLSSLGSSLAVDWVSRRIYWSENDYNVMQSVIWSLDLNYQSKPVKVVTKSMIEIGSIEIDPLRNILIWTEMHRNNQGNIKMCELPHATPTHFFRQALRYKRSLNRFCTCPAHPIVGSAITIDRSDPSNIELLWYDVKSGHITASDMSGCFCRVVINETYGLPPTSITADNEFIYWSNTSLGNVYNFPKNQVVDLTKNSISFHDTHMSTIPGLLLSDSIFHNRGIRGIKAFARNLQPYPNIECLIPLDYNKTVHDVSVTATSATLVIPGVERPSHCQQTSFAAPLFSLLYGKVFLNGTFQCTDSDRSRCKTLETFNTTVTLYDLDPFTNYSVQASVRNYYSPQNVSSFGPYHIFTTKDAQPSVPVNVVTKTATPNKIIVTWQAPVRPNSDSIKYEIRWFTSKSRDFHKAIYTKQPNTTNYGERFMLSLVDLTPNETHYISVRAYASEDNLHSDSGTVTATTFSLPNDIQLIKQSARFITVSWKSPFNSEIAQHTLQSCKIDDTWKTEYSEATQPSTIYNYTIKNLRPHTAYAFRLLLTYRQTTSLFEWPSKLSHKTFVFKTIGDAPGVPASPQIDQLNGHAYKVSWVPVRANGAESITYELQGRKSDETEWILLQNDTSTSWIIGGLESEASYDLRLRAISSYGISNFSSLSNFYYEDFVEEASVTSVIVLTILVVLSFVLVGTWFTFAGMILKLF